MNYRARPSHGWERLSWWQRWRRTRQPLTVVPAEPAPAEPEVGEPATVPLGQRAARGALFVAGVAVAVTLLVVLVVPEARRAVAGTLWPLVALVVLGVLAVALARHYHGLRWARRVVHAQARSVATRKARAERAMRRRANRQRHAAWQAQRDAEAAAERERQREANREAWWDRQGRKR